LSRRPDWIVEMENNDENKKLIKKEWIQDLIEIVVKEIEVELRGDKWQIEEELVLKERKY